MAKHNKADDDDEKPADKSGAKHSHPAPYPPPPTDQSGEPGAMAVPPTKRGAVPLPTPAEPPPPVPTAAEAIAASDAERARLAARVAELEKLANEKGILPPDDPANVKKGEKKVAMKRAVVTPENGSPVEVEYPADTAAEKRDEAAVAAWKVRAGIWDCPTQPRVEHGEK